MIEFTSLSKLATDLKLANGDGLKAVRDLSIDDFLDTNSTQLDSQHHDSSSSSPPQSEPFVMSMSSQHPLRLTDNLNRRRRGGICSSGPSSSAISRTKSMLTRPSSICLTDCSASSFDETTASSSTSGCVDDLVMSAVSSGSVDEHRLKLLESNFNQISIGLSAVFFLL